MKILHSIIREGREIVIDQNGEEQRPGYEIVSMDNWDEPLQYSVVLDMDKHKEIIDDARIDGVQYIDENGAYCIFRAVQRNWNFKKNTVELAFDTKIQRNAFERMLAKKV